MLKIFPYEGWYAVYEHGTKILETDNLMNILEDLLPELIVDRDDTAYAWHDDPEIGCFPESLDNPRPGR